MTKDYDRAFAKIYRSLSDLSDVGALCMPYPQYHEVFYRVENYRVEVAFRGSQNELPEGYDLLTDNTILLLNASIGNRVEKREALTALTIRILNDVGVTENES